MIYNLVSYLVTQLPTLEFSANGFSPDSPKECISVRQTGGDPDHWLNKVTINIQFLSRAESSDPAEFNLTEVYNLVLNRYGLVLPEVTVNERVHPEITAWQLSPIQAPGYIGVNNVNLEQWVFNSITVVSY